MPVGDQLLEVEKFDKFFRSGNSISVERALIPTKEWEKVVSEIRHLAKMVNVSLQIGDVSRSESQPKEIAPSNGERGGSSPSPTVAVAIRDTWNARHKVGDPITFIDDGGVAVRTILTGPCEIISSTRCAQIALLDGWCCIDRLISA